jgi:hypothetical protein
MNSMQRTLVIAACATLLCSQTWAAPYKLVTAGKVVTVAKSAMSVAPTIDWNKLNRRYGRFGESWTLDGLTLNDLSFYGGVANDTTLLREVNKKEKPLPRFYSTMLTPDVAQLFEASYRIAIGTALMTMDSMETATFSGQPGFRFSYSYAVQDVEVRMRGEARGAIVGGKLYMISFEAPAIYYFEHNVAAFHAVADSAKVLTAK